MINEWAFWLDENGHTHTNTLRYKIQSTKALPARSLCRTSQTINSRDANTTNALKTNKSIDIETFLFKMTKTNDLQKTNQKIFDNSAKKEIVVFLMSIKFFSFLSYLIFRTSSSIFHLFWPFAFAKTIIYLSTSKSICMYLQTFVLLFSSSKSKST